MVSQQYVCSFDLTTRASNEEKKEVKGPETPSSSDLILASMTPITCRQTFSSRRWHTHTLLKSWFPQNMESIPRGTTRRFVKHCRQNGNSFLKWQPGKTWQTCLRSSSFEAPFAWWTQSVTNSLHKRFSLHPTTTCQNKLTKADVGGNLICLHLHISSGKMVNAQLFLR